MAAPARKYHTQQVHYLRKTVTYANDGTAVAVGTLPNGANIIVPMSGANVGTAFNDATTDQIDVGFAAYTNSSGSAVTADPNAWATALDVSSAGFKALDETVPCAVIDSDENGVPVTATYNGGTGGSSAGTAEIVICYTV